MGLANKHLPFPNQQKPEINAHVPTVQHSILQPKSGFVPVLCDSRLRRLQPNPHPGSSLSVCFSIHWVGS